MAVLRRHRELADRRRAEADRQRLNRVEHLLISAGDVCKAEPLTGIATIGVLTGGEVTCSLNLNTSLRWEVARHARVPAEALAAMLIHYEQERCLQGALSNRPRTPPGFGSRASCATVGSSTFCSPRSTPAGATGGRWRRASPSCAGTASWAPSGGRSSVGGGSTTSGLSRSRRAADAFPICSATRPPPRWPPVPSAATSASTWPGSRPPP
jgi:hypothetical protein